MNSISREENLQQLLDLTKNKINFLGLFDESWYLQSYPDVLESNQDLLDHYLIYGWKEGRDPSPLFNTNWYLSQNPDVAESGFNPLQHYLEFVQKEKRALLDNLWVKNDSRKER